MIPSEQRLLGPQDWVPNNPTLPVLIYRGLVAPDCADPAGALEQIFRDHGWSPRWRDIVWDYHHYHTNAHELLGVFAGQATLMVGGPGGPTIALTIGDALILPVGTGHCCVERDAAFQVIGAYPPGQGAFDTCRDAPTPMQWEQIRALPPYPGAPLNKSE